MKRFLSVVMLATLVVVGSNVGAVEARAGCGNTVNATYIACVHEHHGHRQFQGGQGTHGHTWSSYQREARQLRAYLLAVYVTALRRQLVNHWSGVAHCESGGNWSINSGNGHYGGLQFNFGTWQAYGGRGYPHQQPAWYQAQIADRVRVGSQGLGAWPHCGQYYR